MPHKLREARVVDGRDASVSPRRPSTHLRVAEAPSNYDQWCSIGLQGTRCWVSYGEESLNFNAVPGRRGLRRAGPDTPTRIFAGMPVIHSLS